MNRRYKTGGFYIISASKGGFIQYYPARAELAAFLLGNVKRYTP